MEMAKIFIKMMNYDGQGLNYKTKGGLDQIS
jgi:hypothetical protein